MSLHSCLSILWVVLSSFRFPRYYYSDAHTSGMLLAVAFAGFVPTAAAWLDYADTGEATMTHYTMDLGFVAACGCTGDSTYYPTAAMSQMAYGSSTAYGPACGRCFNLTLENTYTPTPPFIPVVTKSVVVKVTDLCPLGGSWCNATESAPNKAGRFINFDLVYPSTAIPDGWFPSNASFYGYTDFGVWNVSYAVVSCEYWAGWHQASALGSVTSLGIGACCPANPTGSSNDTCPSYSDANGIPPDTHTSAGLLRVRAPTIPVMLLALLISIATSWTCGA